MITSFKSKDTDRLFRRQPTSFPVEIYRRALKKLLHLHAATRIEDLQVPPGNHLEKLSGNREGQWSLRINKQYRICFIWKDGSAHEVEIIDYH